jgi:hypothetical protein
MGKSLRRVCAVVGTTLLLSVVVVSIAAAGYKKGQYAGTTSQDREFSFKAKKLGVKNFNFTVELDCADGSVEGFLNTGAQAPTNAKGKFTATFLGEGTSVVKGRLKRKKAEGTIESEGFSETGSPCSSKVDWSAKRR